MERIFTLLLALLIPIYALAYTPEFEEWSQEEMDYANTAKDVPVSDETKLVYLYCNLARMDGEKFARTYLDRYVPQIPWQPSSYYLNSLYEDLKKVKGLPRLRFSSGLESAATFHSADMGSNGLTGHVSSDGTSFSNRVHRYIEGGHVAECCSYGYASALGIVLQLLIDDEVESLGHRKIILDPTLNYVGVSISTHSKYQYNSVLDFGKGMDEEVSIPESKSVPEYRSYKPKSTAEYEAFYSDPLHSWMVTGEAKPNHSVLVALNKDNERKNVYCGGTVPSPPRRLDCEPKKNPSSVVTPINNSTSRNQSSASTASVSSRTSTTSTTSTTSRTSTASAPSRTSTASVPSRTSTASAPSRTSTASVPSRTSTASVPSRTSTASVPSRQNVPSKSYGAGYQSYQPVASTQRKDDNIIIAVPVLVTPVFRPGTFIIADHPGQIVYGPSPRPVKQHTTRDRFYNYCGRRFLAIGKFGYSYSIPENAHMINGGLLSFRARLFGLSLLDGEYSISPKTKSFNWHPTMRVYIPTSRATNISLYTGATVEAMSTFNRINEGRNYESRDLFVSSLGGISFDFQPLWIMPISVFCEYRYRMFENGNHIDSHIIGDRHGVYVGAQISLGVAGGY